MRTIKINGFFVQVTVTYDQNAKDEVAALEEALRELRVQVLREKARVQKGD